MTIKQAIKLGEVAVIDFINNNLILDIELRAINRYQKIVKSEKIDLALDNYFEKKSDEYINEESTKFNLCLNETLCKAFAKCEDKDYLKLLATEISKRNNEYKISPVILKKIVRSRGEELESLALLESKTRRDYMFSKDFSKLDLEKSFNNYVVFQLSGLFKSALTSPAEFINSLSLWKKRSDDIKKCFNYFDIDSVNAVFSLNYKNGLDPTNDLIFKELVTDYLNYQIDSKKFGINKPNKLDKDLENVFVSNFKRVAKEIAEKIDDKKLVAKIKEINICNHQHTQITSKHKI